MQSDWVGWAAAAAALQLVFVGVVYVSGEGPLSLALGGGPALAKGWQRVYPYSMWWPASAAVLLLFAAGALWMTFAPRRVVVKAKRDVTAFSVLTGDDVEECPGLSPDARHVKSLADALKQVTVVPLKRGEVLSEGMLLRPVQPPPDMNGWRVLSVPLGGAPAPVAGEKVLLTTAKEGEAQNKTQSWSVLALGVSGERLVVAAAAADADRIAECLLANRPLLVFREVRREANH